MRRLACVFLMMLLCVPCKAVAPLYRAGQTQGFSLSRFVHGEISAGYQLSNLSLQDYKEEYRSSRLRGGNVRALWTPLPWFSIGADYTRFGTVDLKQAWVRSYTLSRTGAVIKLTLSPDTNPRFYLLGGVGKSRHHLKFTTWFAPYKESSWYEMAGLGVETAVYKSVFAAAEGNIYWHQKEKIHSHYRLSHRVEISLGLRAGVRF